MKAHWGARAFHARVVGFVKGLLEPPRISDCTIAVFSGGLGSYHCEVPSSVLDATELHELAFRLERPT